MIVKSAFPATLIIVICACMLSSNADQNNTISQRTAARAECRNKYIPYLDRVNFFEAWQACYRDGLRLAVVNSVRDSQLLDQALESVSKDFPFYIAGTDLGQSGNWRWITTNKEITYQNWKPGEPNNLGGNEHCIDVFKPHGSKWNDIDCNTLYRYVCEEY